MAVAVGAYIEHEVTAFGGHVGEEADNFRRRFKIEIMLNIAPGVVMRIDGLPGAGDRYRRHFRIAEIPVIAQVVPYPAAEQAAGLQYAQAVDHLPGLGGGKSAWHIKPYEAQGAVVGEQFFQLRY